MFGRRCDGKKVRNIDPFMRIVPHIMYDRNDAMVMQFQEIDCENLDKYIFDKRKKEGLRLTYMDVVMASFVRVLSIRPKLNRFIMNGRIYKRNNIQISLSVKKKLIDQAEETTIKMSFDGTESINDIMDKIHQTVKENQGEIHNDTDHIAKILTRTPNFLIKASVRFLMWMDKHGMLSKKIIDVSPFHTSIFVTNLKSIKMEAVLHHIYNFGTTGIFVSMGKETWEPKVINQETKEIAARKIMKMGIVIDERICDGLYNSLSLREFKKIMENPYILDEQNNNVILDD
ncbi:MAG: 2-oxo acid dehydrogenase subunit E2 [Candidatus Izemoplasmatales bacterium]|nr:2-oxo acid dehydrogenase subunit E2 [Candidatus Izemoplasmatales bacterium]